MKLIEATKGITRVLVSKLKIIVYRIITQYKETSKGVEWMANILVPVTAALQCMGTGLPFIIDFILFTAVFLGLFLLLRRVVIFLTRPICKPYFRSVFNGLSLFASIFVYLVTTVSGRISILHMIFEAAVIVLLEHLFVRSLYAFCKNRKKRGIIPIMLALTLLGNVAFCVFLFGAGIHTNMVEQCLTMQTSHDSKGISSLYESSLEPGKYSTAYIDYGMKNDHSLRSNTIDLSSYLWDNTGVKKWIRKMYLGYDTSKVPLQGRIWYPLECNRCPVLFIIHGNHSITTDSYMGYAYLGEHLASRGYVVVSVDENVCNYYLPEGIHGENSARAYLLLENIRQIQSYNLSGPLAGKMDFSNLALMGHSRGGEAVALAALYNELGHNPDVGYQKYDYHYSIKSIIAVAPTTDQYMPAGRDVMLEDVNYMLIQGSNDQDVSEFMGRKQYNNTKFTGMKDCYKTYLYIAGANHGQFNTTWQQDYDYPRNLMLNQADVMDGEEQRELLTGYMTAFLDDTLYAKNGRRALFQDNNHMEDTMPKTVYISGYEDSTFEALATYEEDSSLDTITAERGQVVTRHLAFNSEQAVKYHSQTSTYETNNHVAYIWWNRSIAVYELDLSDRQYSSSPNRYLQFDVADVNESQDSMDRKQLLDFDIMITDGSGNEATVSLGEVCNVYPPLLVRLYKLQLSRESMDEKTELQTVRIPLQLFLQKNPMLDLQHIAFVKYCFTKQPEGRILLDNIGFSK